jgi:hypothetical protein
LTQPKSGGASEKFLPFPGNHTYSFDMRGLGGRIPDCIKHFQAWKPVNSKYTPEAISLLAGLLTEDRKFADARAQYDEIPSGATVYVVDDEGLWTNAFWQPTWMTSVGRALWGDDRAVRALPSDFIETVVRGQGGSVYLVEYDSGHLRKVSLESVKPPPE